MSETSRIGLCVREQDDMGEYTVQDSYSRSGMPVISSEDRPRRTFSLSEGRPVCIFIGDRDADITEGMPEDFLAARTEGVKRRSDSAAGTGTPDSLSRASDKRLEDAVTEIIRRLGIPANIKGYRYIRTAVMMCLADPELLESVTGRLYPEIAHRHDSTPTRVERAIRHAITVAWDRAEGDEEYVSRRLHCRIDFSTPRPTNSELIALISDSLMLEGRSGAAYPI